MSTVPDTPPSLDGQFLTVLWAVTSGSGEAVVAPRRSRIVLPVLLMLSLLATACDPVGDDDGSAASSPTDVAPTEIEAAFDQDPDCFGFEPADAEQIDCGTVEVPLDHGAPAEGSIELAVVVDGAVVTDRTDAPLLVLGGGPGEVLVEPYLTTPQLRQVFAAERTTIIIDQRGAGSSNPALTCPELPAPEVQESAAEDIDAALDAMGACRERLIDEGVDLDAYNHLANARDVDVVRRALGHDQLNPRGTSYGTQVALLAAEMFPGTVRSVVLSFPLDPRANWMEGVPGGETITLTYTPSRFIGGLFTFFYQAQLTAMLPAVVDRAHDGDLAPLANIVALLEEQLEGSVTAGMQQSMLCTGEAGLVDVEQALANVDDELIAEHWYPHTMIGEPVEEFCDRWDVEQIYDPAEISLDAEVPTLVVTGGLDHVTPPQLGEQVHDALSISHLIEVEEAVHASLEALSLPGTCGQGIVTDFLDDPHSAPDAACAADFALPLDTPLPPALG